MSIDKKLAGFRQISQEKLQNILCSIPSSQKDLVIEPSLIKPLEHVCGASWLRIKGINKIYKFDQENVPPKATTMVYLISSKLIMFKHVLDQIQKLEPRYSEIVDDLAHFHIIVVPNVLNSFQSLLEEMGLFGLVRLHRFNWDFLNLDANILSLEYPQIFQDVFVDNDLSLISSVAHSMRVFNMVFGRPQVILTYGEHSEKILDMVDRMEGFQPKNQQKTCDFSAMVVIDRNKDYASSLLTPVVYSGLLLEIFQSNSGTLQIDVNANKIKSEKLDFLQVNPATVKSTADVTHLRLSGSNDRIYNENRYRHFSEVVTLLSAQAKALGMEGKNLKGMQLAEIQEYVAKKLPKVASHKKDLIKHLILCETIVNELGGQFEKIQTIEESMLFNRNKKQVYTQLQEILSIDAHKFNALRHICLMHLTCGLTNEEATGFITNYLNAFGYKHMNVFPNLTNAGLFPEIENVTKAKLPTISLPKWQSGFQIEANKLKLLPEHDVATKSDPICPSYVFNGSYIPLVAQIASVLLTSESYDQFFAKISSTDQLKMFQYYDRCKESVKDIGGIIKSGAALDAFPLKPKSIFIFILGGLTYAEVAACQLVERLSGAKIVIGSNCVISGRDIVEA
ncbi:Vacuolar protein sorting-associated protein 33B, partial [Pseudolycoriella hygida]